MTSAPGRSGRLTARGVWAVAALGPVAIGVLVWLEFGDRLAVAGSTLAVAALFNPLRQQVHTGVDRRFNRTRYDSERVADRFADDMRDEVDPDRIMAAWMAVIGATRQHNAVGVWLSEAR